MAVPGRTHTGEKGSSTASIKQPGTPTALADPIAGSCSVTRMEGVQIYIPSPSPKKLGGDGLYHMDS
ncbi:hypothetical protein AAFF_G00330860 [Aldrovandia affinis]|uniref:Uncharacterized protein n=1 Tax=Aldrovandia affinis TaxID=143900 RepID=A0AAD7R6U2_9TELE|nr:hypothetical protein AAFF_G00330860 [Aldrovandia affinis]